MFRVVSIVLAALQVQVSFAACVCAISDPVELFQAYLKIDTTSNNDLTEAVEFWKALADAADVPVNVYEIIPGYPIVVLKWAGADSSQKSIMLNSHMDVVPAHIEDGWTYDPFAGHIDDNGIIYGRGTQDMKSVSIQYYEALRRLKENNVTLLRDVYMTLMPDEEIGGENGMVQFIQTEAFAAMNVGIELDEGGPFPLPVIAVLYQDKTVWQIQVDCHGVAAHGSTVPKTDTTATGKCLKVVNKLFEFRDEQYEIAKTALPNYAGAYTSCNLDILRGGTANNVIPNIVSLIFDIRLSATVKEEEFEETLNQWIAEAGDNITLTYILKNHQSPATMTNSTNPYWNAIASAAEELNIELMPTMPPGATDGRFLRLAGYPSLGFSPMPSTQLLVHMVNERLAVSTFLDGIKIYEKVIDNLANIPGSETSENSSDYLYTTA